MNRLLGGIALSILTLATSFAPLGCTQAQKNSVAQDIVNWTPSLQSAVAVIDSTGAVLEPAASPIFIAATVAFDAGSTLVVDEAKAYLANPTTTVLATLQQAVVTFQQNVSSAVLAAAKIVDPKSQQLALAAINGVSTAINIILGLVQSISAKADLRRMADESPIKLAMIEPYLNKHAMPTVYGVTPARFFAGERAMGF